MIRINIDGKEIEAHKGQTILEVARKNGINIPTLCYDERVKVYGGCGLCVVETRDNPKLLRACATEIAPGMIVKTSSPRIDASRRFTLELLLSDHVGDCRGPCLKACPAHTDVQGYVGLIANRQYRKALELIKEKVPLPASIGRVCPHPCEAACRRQLVEDPVSIAFLKAFAADLDLAGGKPYIPEIKAQSGKRVAIVGAGPAGLTAAYFLAREGHAITVYDAMPAGGGMLRYGIPEYRLPKMVLDQEIDLIRDMGVEFKFNTRIGSDVSLDYLMKENDAVFLGIGAWLSSEMRCEGEDLPGVVGGIDFLREVALHKDVKPGQIVAVVGGGNTAMDAARTAVRLGCEKVMVLYRRTRAEMPAEDIEIKEAGEEGIEFRFLVAPLEVLAENGRANAIRLQKMQLGEADASGRRSPVPIPGEEEIVYVDTVISAIGQKVNPAGMGEVALSKWGTIEVDEDTLATSIPGVFAGGDGVTGPQIAIDAVAQGGRAACSINEYLRGGIIPRKEQYTVEQKGLGPEDFADYEKAARVEMPHRSAQERRNNFREVNLGLSESEAVAEAKRCLECGCKDYYECRLLEAANQYQVNPDRLAGEQRREKLKEKTAFMERNSEKCILCGLCARICREVVGVNALGLVDRGFDSMVAPEFKLPLRETPCISCGQCAAVCPTGALGEVYPIVKNVPLEMKEMPSICSFCSMGCKQVVHSHGDLVLEIRPPEGGLLCPYGRFGFSGYETGERLTKPLLRRNDELIETSWEEAFHFIDDKLKIIKAGEKSRATAVFISPSCSLEEAGAAVELGHKVLGTGRISTFTPNPARGLEVPGLKTAYRNSLEELQGTDLILMVGNWQESQVAAMKVREAARAGAGVIVISSQDSLVDDLACYKVVAENNTAILKEILTAIVKKEPAAGSQGDKAGLYDKYRQDLETGPEAQRIAELYTGARTAMIIVDGNTVTAAAVQLLGAIASISGKTGAPRNGVIVITPGSNQNGLSRLGVAYNTGLLNSLSCGEVPGVFILGEDPVGGGLLSPEQIAGMELAVVQSPFMTPTAAAAHVVLPAATPLETQGTYIRCDGQAQAILPVKAAPGGFDNRDIMSRLIGALGSDEPLAGRETPAEGEEISAVKPELYGVEKFFDILPLT
ncbi:MAG: FAD-dependent oxidoreductase, partial [Syntrophomonas sp.]